MHAPGGGFFKKDGIMAMDITKSLPTRPAAAHTARAAGDSDKSTVPAPATPENDAVATENVGADALDPARLAEVIRRANASAELFSTEHRNVRFEINETTQRVVVKVLDQDNETVVRQYPPEEFLEMAARLREFRNVLVDKTA